MRNRAEEAALKAYPNDTYFGGRSAQRLFREGYEQAEKEYETILAGWAARDRNGALFFHNEKPHRCYDCVWHTEWSYHPSPELFHLRLKDSALPDLKWENEPIEVELKIVRL